MSLINLTRENKGITLSEAVIQNTMQKVLSMRDQEPSLEWLNTLVDTIKLSYGIKRGFDNIGGVSLTLVKDAWDDIPLDVRKHLGYDFMTWAMSETGYQTSSLNNIFTTMRLWFLEDREFPREIEIWERTSDKRPIIENGRKVTKRVPLELSTVSFSKMLVLNATLRKDNMDDTLWRMLADSVHTQEDILRYLKGDSDSVNFEPRFIPEGGYICFSLMGEVVPIGHLDWEGYRENDLVKQGIDYMFKRLGMEMDEEAISRMMRNGS